MADRDTSGSYPDDDNLAAGDTGEQRRLVEAERRGLGKGAFAGLGLAVLLVLIIGAVLIWFNPFSQGPAADNTAPVTSLPAPTSEPTESLPLATATTAPPSTPDPSAAATTTPTASADLALNRWNWIPDQRSFSVAGFIEGTEPGGSCTLTAANGSVTFVATEPATPDVTTTICVVNLHSPDVASGDWQLTMTYDGPSGPATSETVTVTVP
ncbi:hypothetical protein GCM10011490_15010 [Pseudoclavibacter endophyticus]|uniref:Uncharacterized protein n=1 Tax=Pseudoclavibacter endophyticus TaxID=1778590 RepID=A0A6H9WS15_9MICO|nr:hypothetical protein [Pseudoclavibacter endophyticus]KAB1649110.1 hypothetical protein F8O04_02175 [Pseudoclavibacter endophyticus]GGA65331.1 hypothetical protein GCM10011490_15010 [Pseudoclavibacter endophyticus]